MKKKNLKSLKLNKTSISNLETSGVIGGASDSPICDPSAASCAQTCALTCPAWCDIPTINDSCFSWCADKCNEF